MDNFTTSVPDINLKTYMGMSKEAVATLLKTVSGQNYLSNKHFSAMFPLDCALIIMNLGQKKEIGKNEIKIIVSGLMHESSEVRKKALYVASFVVHLSQSRALQDLLSEISSVIVEDRQPSSILKYCVPKNRPINYDVFFSLYIMAIGEKFEDIEIQKLLREKLAEILQFEVFCDYLGAKKLNEKRKFDLIKAEKLAGLIQAIAPKWVSLILQYVPCAHLTFLIFVELIQHVLRRVKFAKFFKFILCYKVNSFLVNTYSDKCFPCNAYEMSCFIKLNSEKNGSISRTVSECFLLEKVSDLPKDEIIELSRENNGLLSWYLYTLLPYYFQSTDSEFHETLELVKRIGNCDNKVSKFIAVNCLWIACRFVDFKGREDLFSAISEEYKGIAEKFIVDNGGLITFKHPRGEKRDDSLTRAKFDQIATFMESRIEHGLARVGLGGFDYDSGVLMNYIDYIFRSNNSKNVFEIIMRAIINLSEKEPSENRGQHFLNYSVSVLGDVGEHFPDHAVETLIKFAINFEELSRYILGLELEKVQEKIARSMAKISRIHPISVFSKISCFPAEWQSILDVKITRDLDSALAELSHSGEVLYQKILLHKSAREVFSKGILNSCNRVRYFNNRRRLRTLFGSFTREVVEWIEKNPNLIIPENHRH